MGRLPGAPVLPARASRSWGPRSGRCSSGNRRSRRSIASCARVIFLAPGVTTYVAPRPRGRRSVARAAARVPRARRCPRTSEAAWRPGSGGACSRHASAWPGCPSSRWRCAPGSRAAETAALGAAARRPGASCPTRPRSRRWSRSSASRPRSSLLARPGSADRLPGRRDGGLHPAPDGLLEPAVRRPARLGDPAGLGRPLARAPRRPVAGRPVLLALGMTALSAWVAVGIRRRPFDALLAALPLAARGAVPRRRLALPARLVRGRACSGSSTESCRPRSGRRVSAPASSSTGWSRPAADPRSRPLVALAGDRAGRRPAGPRRPAADARRLAGGGRVAHPGGGDARATASTGSGARSAAARTASSSSPRRSGSTTIRRGTRPTAT